MVMEIVAGTPLSELVATRGGLQLFEFLRSLTKSVPP